MCHFNKNHILLCWRNLNLTRVHFHVKTQRLDALWKGVIFFLLWSNSKPIFLHAFRRFCLIGCANRQKNIAFELVCAKKSRFLQFKQNKTAFCLNSYLTKIGYKPKWRVQIVLQSCMQPTVVFVRYPSRLFPVSGPEEVLHYLIEGVHYITVTS